MNVRNRDRCTSNIVQSREWNLKVVRALLKHVKVVANANDDDGNTALIVASGRGHLGEIHELAKL